MATNVFLLLDSLGLVFLIYALANFWTEGQRDKRRNRREVPPDAQVVGDRDAIIRSAHRQPSNGNSVIPFPAPHRQIHGAPQHGDRSATIEMRKREALQPRAGRVGK